MIYRHLEFNTESMDKLMQLAKDNVISLIVKYTNDNTHDFIYSRCKDCNESYVNYNSTKQLEQIIKHMNSKHNKEV
jgi:hypothetical protein